MRDWIQRLLTDLAFAFANSEYSRIMICGGHIIMPWEDPEPAPAEQSGSEKEGVNSDIRTE